MTSRDGETEKTYLVSLSKHLLVHENDFVRAGEALSDGQISPQDILAILGPTAVQEYLVNEVQEVYRLQGVGINDKHIEVVVRQMMQKVRITDPGDTPFLEGNLVDRIQLEKTNDELYDTFVVVDPGESELRIGESITRRQLRETNSQMTREAKQAIEVRDAELAVAEPVLLGITQAALATDSFISAASFQETTKVLTEAAIAAKRDELLGLKENVHHRPTSSRPGRGSGATATWSSGAARSSRRSRRRTTRSTAGSRPATATSSARRPGGRRRDAGGDQPAPRVDHPPRQPDRPARTCGRGGFFGSAAPPGGCAGAACADVGLAVTSEETEPPTMRRPALVLLIVLAGAGWSAPALAQDECPFSPRGDRRRHPRRRGVLPARARQRVGVPTARQPPLQRRRNPA